MSHDRRPPPLEGLPPDLVELDAELSDLLLEERPSFAPELRAELRRVHAERLRRGPGHRMWVRHAMAAAVAGLAFLGLFSPARAALARVLFQIEEPKVETELPERPRVEEPAELRLPSLIEEDGIVPLPPDVAAVRPVSDEGPPRLPAVLITAPELVDREAGEKLVQRYYPRTLQRLGVGGTVTLRLWVDTTGAVSSADLAESSGVPELDDAALNAARNLRFIPGTQRGVPRALPVQLPLVFEPLTDDAPTRTALDLGPVGMPAPPRAEVDIGRSWDEDVVVPTPFPEEAEEMLEDAMASRRDVIEARFGPLEGLLRGDPPAGESPNRWRADVAAALEEARLRDPDNPAPYLALARIRRKQGLSETARALFEAGLKRARTGNRALPAELLADLHYELGTVLREGWLAWRDFGTVPSEALERFGCARARGEVKLTSQFASADGLIAWNYACSDQFDRVIQESFQPSTIDAEERRAVAEEFEAAVAALPGHVAANVEMLLNLADDGRFYDMLEEAERFSRASVRHPYAFLMKGIALQRLGRSEEAHDAFVQALSDLPRDLRARLTDISLLDRVAARQAALLSGEARERALDGYWRRLDPLLLTEVSEREVEHLARTSYAELRLGGVDTDAGGVWVRYGRPQAVHSVGVGSEMRTEFWDYGVGPDLTFRRPATSPELDLTREARSYIEELRALAPHRYGLEGRSVTRWEGSVTRFRAGDETEISLRARVPDAFAAAEEDLELAIFQIDRDGAILWSDRRHVSHPRRLDEVVLAGSEVETVVVELFDAGSGRALSLRAPAHRRAPREDPRISDILVVNPMTPSAQNTSRRAEWVQPVSDHRALSGGSIGVLFELYDLPTDRGPYEVRFHLMPHEARMPLALSTRPAGQVSFATEWSRMPLAGHGPVTEYFTLDISQATPGAYTLKLVLDLPGGETIEQSLDVGLLDRSSRTASGGLESPDAGTFR